MINTKIAHQILGISQFNNIGETPYPQAEELFNAYITHNPSIRDIRYVVNVAAHSGNLYVLERCYKYEPTSFCNIDNIADTIINKNHFHVLEWIINDIHLPETSRTNDVMIIASHIILKCLSSNHDMMKYIKMLHSQYPTITTQIYPIYFKRSFDLIVYSYLNDKRNLRDITLLKFIHSLYPPLITDISTAAIKYYYMSNNRDALDYIFIHNPSAFENIHEYLDNNETQTLRLYAYLIRKFCLKLNHFKNERYNKLAHIYHLYYIEPMMRFILK